MFLISKWRVNHSPFFVHVYSPLFLSLENKMKWSFTYNGKLITDIAEETQWKDAY